MEGKVSLGKPFWGVLVASGCVCRGGPLSVWGEDGAVPGSVGTSRARELARPGDTQHTGDSQSGCCSHRAAMAKARGGAWGAHGVGARAAFGASPLCWGNVPFLSSFLFSQPRAHSRLPSGARRLRRPPELPYPPEMAPPHAAPAGTVGWAATGALRGARGGENLEHLRGAFRCQSIACWRCLSMPIRSAPALPFRANPERAGIDFWCKSRAHRRCLWVPWGRGDLRSPTPPCPPWRSPRSRGVPGWVPQHPGWAAS